jgi:hypothetical protein
MDAVGMIIRVSHIPGNIKGRQSDPVYALKTERRL